MKNKKETLAIVLMLIIFGAFIFTACEEPCDHVWDIPAATCTEAQTCSLCGRVNRALGHRGEWIIDYQPTVDSEGLKKINCARCGPIEEVIPMLVPTPGLTFNLRNGIDEYEVSIGAANATEIIINSKYNDKFVTAIAVSGFINRTNITSVIIPNSVTTIGDNAFKGCNSLANVTFNENSNVTSIGNSAFRDCTNLASISIPNSVTTIGEYAFNGCTSITSIIIPNGITAIENGVFGNTGLTSITIHSNITSIGKYAFAMCYSLTTITIPNSVTSVGEYAFNLWGATQTINISPRTSLNPGGGWDAKWRDECNAKITGGSGQLFP